MTCSLTLDQLVNSFENEFLCKGHRLQETVDGWAARNVFLSKYPFVDQPNEIGVRMQSPPQVQDFFHLIEVDLRPLGGLKLFNDLHIRSATDNIKTFRDALSVATDGSVNLASRIDDGVWSKLKGFGGDRHIAKKIVATYFPDETMPIFNTSHLEHFADRLCIDRTMLAQKSTGTPYDSLTLGEKWQLLSEALINAKGHLPALTSRDNVYYMGCLYTGYLRPGPPFRPNPCPRHPDLNPPNVVDEVLELETGIRSASPEVRKAIELQAMAVATEHLRSQGWNTIQDVSSERGRGYDLHCKRDGEVLMVEVKGKANEGRKVLLTANEVLHAQDKHPHSALIVVSGIDVTRDNNGQVHAAGGEVRELNPWDPKLGTLTPIAYRYELP